VPSLKIAVPLESNLPSEIIVVHLRRRAAILLTSRLGIGAVTVTSVCRQARMAKKTFYDNFENVSDCLGFGLGMAFEQTLGETRDAEPPPTTASRCRRPRTTWPVQSSRWRC